MITSTPSYHHHNINTMQYVVHHFYFVLNVIWVFIVWIPLNLKLFHLLSSWPLALWTPISFCPEDCDFAENKFVQAYCDPCHICLSFIQIEINNTIAWIDISRKGAHPSSFPNRYGDGDNRGDCDDDRELPVELQRPQDHSVRWLLSQSFLNQQETSTVSSHSIWNGQWHLLYSSQPTISTVIANICLSSVHLPEAVCTIFTCWWWWLAPPFF